MHDTIVCLKCKWAVLVTSGLARACPQAACKRKKTARVSGLQTDAAAHLCPVQHMACMCMLGSNKLLPRCNQAGPQNPSSTNFDVQGALLGRTRKRFDVECGIEVLQRNCALAFCFNFRPIRQSRGQKTRGKFWVCHSVVVRTSSKTYVAKS